MLKNRASQHTHTHVVLWYSYGRVVNSYHWKKLGFHREMAGVAFGPSASADRQRSAFYRGHATISLRRGCMMYADNIGRLRQRSLDQCMYDCTQLPGCGAVAFLRMAAYYTPLGAVEWVDRSSGVGLCEFRHANCTAKATIGACVGDYKQQSKKGWCVYALPRPSGTCRAPRISALP